MAYEQENLEEYDCIAISDISSKNAYESEPLYIKMQAHTL